MEAPGIESPDTSTHCVVDRRIDDADHATKSDAKRRGVSASGDIVEAALARAIDAETETRGAGWQARVTLLATELQARRRRCARDRVLAFEGKRRQHGR